MIIVISLAVWGGIFSQVGAQSGLVPNCEGINCDWEQLFLLAENVLEFLVEIAVAVCTLTIAYAGFVYMRHASSDGKRSEAKKLLWRAVIGLIVALSATLIVKTIIAVLLKPEYQGIIK